MVRFEAGSLKLSQNVLTTLYLIIKVTGGVLVAYFKSYEFLMMLEILSAICLTRNLSTGAAEYQDKLCSSRGNRTRRIQICNKKFPVGIDERVKSPKNQQLIFLNGHNSSKKVVFGTNSVLFLLSSMRGIE